MLAPRRRVVNAVIFFPRGGSAQVTRSLARELPACGWEVSVVSGSRSDEGPHTDAVHFYAGIDVHPVDFTAALRAPDPMDPPGGAAPMHPSFEDRPGAADRVLASLDEAEGERQVRAWEEALAGAGAGDADVLHLNHLTPIHEAARRRWPEKPMVGHLHGTELLMLEEIEQGNPAGWAHAALWQERMRGWAAGCDRLIVLSPDGVDRAVGLLGVEPERIEVVPNGFDPRTFHPLEVDRLAHWRRHLVDEPQGWKRGAGPGSVGYAGEDLEVFAEGPVLLYVGRFTAVKRIPLLIRAFARAQQEFGVRASLVLLGGHPGEWEGEHPLEAIEASGARDVFLAGWHGHEELPDFFAASDVVVLPSVREQFGQVLVEGMACGLPVIAVNRSGPATIVEDGETGWLVGPDDEEDLARALVDAVSDEAQRRRRGAAAREAALARYSWPAIGERVAALYSEVCADLA